MLCFFGLHTVDRLPAARAFAEAMQLTNFLRDIREDFEILGRVYLPKNEMEHFGVTVDDIKNHSIFTFY
jgi:phytoene synthase